MIKLLKPSALLALTLSMCATNTFASPSPELTKKMKSFGVVHNHQIVDGGLTAWTIGTKTGKVAVFYTTPDEKVMIKGDLWHTSDRKNISDAINIKALNYASPDFKNRVLASVKKPQARTQPKATEQNYSAEIVGAYKGPIPKIITFLDESAGFKEGNGSPTDTLYVYFDPRCKWCHESFRKTRTYIQKGFSIKWLPTLALGRDNETAATALAKAATLLQNPKKDTLENLFSKKADLNIQVTDKSRQQIDLNLENLLALAASFKGEGARVTVPTGFYLNKKTGKVKMVEALSEDIFLDQVFGQ
jgi:hypothetical protein